MKREAGNIGDLMAACICMLLMTVLLVAYMDSVRLLDEKTEINQIARKYIPCQLQQRLFETLSPYVPVAFRQRIRHINTRLDLDLQRMVYQL